MRRECPEISWGSFAVLRTRTPVLAMRYDWRQTSLVTLHNFSDHTQRIQLKVDCQGDDVLVNVFDDEQSRARNDGAHALTVPPYGWKWFRVGGADNTLDRSELIVSDEKVL